MDPKFLLDGMLGGLTRWLRICGYDAKYFRNASDEELLNVSAFEKRILLTRDITLHRKAIRKGIDSLTVHGEDESQKLAHVARKYNLNLQPKNSRCPNCGDLLQKTNKVDIKEKIPTRTFTTYDDYWLCNSCDQIYWRGSHWKNIMKTIKKASKITGLS